uniref:Autophagy-related protein 27 n=1 Tax=Anthurium amnicola TaxID=1678845 RepID=A0A1D1XNK5_9ARAE
MVFYLSRKPRMALLRYAHLTTLVVLCLAILSFSSGHFVKADDPQPQPCTVTNETTNKYYDLSPLTRKEGEDWIVKGYGTGWTFRINICHGVLYRDENDKSSDFDQIGVYGKNENDDGMGDHSLGSVSQTPIFRGDNLVMEFTKGKFCGGTNYKRSSAISFICDQTVEGQGQPKFVSTFYDCAFFFEWRTPAACPTGKKGSAGAGSGGWSVFITIFVIALIAYFVGGIVYNRIVHNASGIYQIPHWEFWSNAVDFLKDMILIILAQCPCFKPRRHGGRNYRDLPRDEENILIGEEFEEH